MARAAFDDERRDGDNHGHSRYEQDHDAAATRRAAAANDRLEHPGRHPRTPLHHGATVAGDTW